jgi:hypothetical protein
MRARSPATEPGCFETNIVTLALVRSDGGPTIRYLPELDGVRGLAIAGVLVFHGGPLIGGHLGVDLFFDERRFRPERDPSPMGHGDGVVPHAPDKAG